MGFCAFCEKSSKLAGRNRQHTPKNMNKITRGLFAVLFALALVASSASSVFAGVEHAGPTGKWIEVSLARQTVYAWQDGRVVMSSRISSGKASTPTRRGTFHIYTKLLSTRMRGADYDLPNVPYTMYFDGSIALHGAYWNPPYGRPSSHGCVNLPISFAARLFRWASVGMTVVVR